MKFTYEITTLAYLLACSSRQLEQQLSLASQCSLLPPFVLWTSESGIGSKPSPPIIHPALPMFQVNERSLHSNRLSSCCDHWREHKGHLPALNLPLLCFNCTTSPLFSGSVPPISDSLVALSPKWSSGSSGQVSKLSRSLEFEVWLSSFRTLSRRPERRGST